MRAESPRQKHHIAAPHTYLSNAMKRAVGALERTGSQFLGPCPRLISNGPLALSSPPGHTISLSPTFNHTPLLTVSLDCTPAQCRVAFRLRRPRLGPFKLESALQLAC